MDGGLSVWVRAILGVDVGFMLAYDVWPVVGVGEGVVGGGVWLARRDGAGGCELVRADMIEVKVLGMDGLDCLLFRVRGVDDCVGAGIGEGVELVKQTWWW